MFSKKKGIILIEILIVIAIFSGIIVFFLFYLTSLSNFSVDDKKLKAQIITKNLVRNCFSNEYGKIEELKFSQETLDNCFLGINENDIFRIGINKEEKLYINSKKELFNQRGQLCSISQKSSQYCKQVIYPIIYINKLNNSQIKFLVIDLIIS